MKKSSEVQIPSHFVLIASLSGGLTIATSTCYLVLSTAALIYRVNCDSGSSESSTGAGYFWKTIFRVYFLKDTCEHKISPSNLTGEYTVFVLTIITLCISAVCIVTAILLILAVQVESLLKIVNLTVFTYIGSCIASLVVDLTTASHFGMDYAHMTSELKQLTYGSGSSYQTETIRQGALMLMSVALKGYIAYAISFVLQILLIVYVIEYINLIKSKEHPIHRLGALSAYDQPRRPEDASSNSDRFSPYIRGAQPNNGYNYEDDSPRRSPMRENPRYDYPDRTPKRTEPWQNPNLSGSNRPFSYLEDLKRPAPAQPTPSPAPESPWRRDPWAPHVPAPDYSPQGARRLKPALKPAYLQ